MTNPQMIAGILTHWRDTFPLPVTTVYPGMRIDTAPLEEWVELWVQTFSRGPHRAGRVQVDLSVTVHCFVKQGTDTGNIHALAEAARSTLAHRTIAVRDFAASGTPTVGYAKLFEFDLHDLTRADRDAQKHNLQHVVLSGTGIAEGEG